MRLSLLAGRLAAALSLGFVLTLPSIAFAISLYSINFTTTELVTINSVDGSILDSIPLVGDTLAAGHLERVNGNLYSVASVDDHGIEGPSASVTVLTR